MNFPFVLFLVVFTIVLGVSSIFAYRNFKNPNYKIPFEGSALNLFMTTNDVRNGTYSKKTRIALYIIGIGAVIALYFVTRS